MARSIELSGLGEGLLVQPPGASAQVRVPSAPVVETGISASKRGMLVSVEPSGAPADREIVSAVRSDFSSWKGGPATGGQVGIAGTHLHGAGLLRCFTSAELRVGGVSTDVVISI
jgi:hypothetical protein